MAEIITKLAVFSPFSHHHNQNKGQIYPVACSIPVKNQQIFVGFSSLKSNFGGSRIKVVRDYDYLWSYKRGNSQSIYVKMGLSIGKAQRWWEKGHQPNMKEITSAEELVDSLLKAGDQLVVLDFFSPGCGGCKALHPKICQLAEMNPDVQFLQVNYEEHKSMCYSLNVHVLPFFRIYRGSEGRVCSFSCTNATIKKFKDALAKYSPPRCSLGPPKGLEEKELAALAANQDLSFTYTPKPVVPQPDPVFEEVVSEKKAEDAGENPSPSRTNLPYPSTNPSPSRTNLPYPSTTVNSFKDSKNSTLVSAGR